MLQAKKSALEFDKDDVLWDVLFQDDPEAEEVSKKFWNILVPGKNCDPNQIFVGKLETRAFKALYKHVRSIQNKQIQVYLKPNFGVYILNNYNQGGPNGFRCYEEKA